jgi:hypothetical protein
MFDLTSGWANHPKELREHIVKALEFLKFIAWDETMIEARRPFPFLVVGRSQGNSSFWTAMMVLMPIAFLLAGVLEFQKRKKQRLIAVSNTRQADEEEKLYISAEDVILPDLTDTVTRVVLKRNERCCAMAHNVKEIVFRKHTKYIGGSRGVSFRIPGMPKSLSPRMHVGRYRGHSETTTAPQVDDTGSLYITDLRIVFAGIKQVESIPLAKIADVRCDAAVLQVFLENRANPYLFERPIPALASCSQLRDAC